MDDSSELKKNKREGGRNIREFDELLPYNSRILIIEEQFERTAAQVMFVAPKLSEE